MIFGFFKRLAEAEANAERLKQENLFYRECFESAKADASLWHKRYIAEVAGNRKREDDLKNEIIRASSPNARLPVSRLEENNRPEEKPEIDTEFEDQVKTVARQLVEDAERRGTIFSESEKVLLEIRIRENPQDYLY